jgi:DNA-binding CsgD family transcriptional regulator
MTGRFIGRSAVGPMIDVQSSAEPDETTLVHLVGQLYDAAVGQDDWTVVLRRLSGMLGGTAMVLHHFRTPLRDAATTAIHTDPGNIGLYHSHYHKTEPKLAIFPHLQAGAVFVDRMLMPEADLTRTEYYNDFLVPQDIHSSLNWIDFNRQGLPDVGLSMWRPRHWNDWGDRQVNALRQLGPHLGRALRVERRLAGVADEDAAAARPRPALTPRERDCLACIGRGASNKEAARRLGLSVYTVNEYIATAMRKLGAASRTEAVAVALVRGLIDG